MSSWITKKKDRKGRTVYVLRTKTVGTDGKTKVTQRGLGRDKKYAKLVGRKLSRTEAFWGAMIRNRKFYVKPLSFALHLTNIRK